MANMTTEKDTGKDCPNCGGVIYAYTHQSGGAEVTEYHSCKMCGAHWTEDWTPTRPGRAQATTAQKDRFKVKPVLTKRTFNTSQVPGWIWMVVVIVAAMALIRIGLYGFFSAIMTVMVAIILGYIVFRIGKEQRWW